MFPVHRDHPISDFGYCLDRFMNSLSDGAKDSAMENEQLRYVSVQDKLSYHHQECAHVSDE